MFGTNLDSKNLERKSTTVEGWNLSFHFHKNLNSTELGHKNLKFEIFIVKMCIIFIVKQLICKI